MFNEIFLMKRWWTEGGYNSKNYIGRCISMTKAAGKKSFVWLIDEKEIKDEITHWMEIPPIPQNR